MSHDDRRRFVWDQVSPADPDNYLTEPTWSGASSARASRYWLARAPGRRHRPRPTGQAATDDPRMGHIHEGSRTATACKSISAVEILTMLCA